MHMAGMPIPALIAIIVFGVFCALVGVACLIAALRQRAVDAQVAILAAPRETLTDGFGVIVYRAFNRVLISTIGGGILIALFRAKSRA
jgi:ATP-dependent protease Clp ATPase subunit